MQKHEEQFLFLLKCGLNNKKIPEGYQFDVDRVFSLAVKHDLLPIVYDKACGSDMDLIVYKRKVLRSCGNQIRKNAAFEDLFRSVAEENINMIVVKGPVCASCYPTPDLRLSSDFDIVVSGADKDKLHDFLVSHGFSEKNGTYFSEASRLYLEVSTELGEGNDKLKRKADMIFDGFLDRAVTDGNFRTLAPTEHITYLIYHAFKHFIGSGFGIKQIADIYMFTNKFFNKIDFEKMKHDLKNLDILNFAYNVFFLIEKIFNFDCSFILISADKNCLCFDDFLADLMTAGVFGKSSEDRLHSAAVVQEAVENSGKKSVFKAIFPPLSIMQRKFSLLKRFAFLLPLFWLFRLLEYAFKALFGKRTVSPMHSIEIADSRIELMKKMGII